MMLLHVFLFIITVKRFIAVSTNYFLSFGSKASLIPVRHLFICFEVENRLILKEQRNVHQDQTENERFLLDVPKRIDICKVSIQVMRSFTS